MGMNLLLIVVLFPGNVIHSNTIVEITNTIHNILIIQANIIHIRTGVSFFPWRLRKWKHMSDAKYRMEDNHGSAE